ncbi:MAG: hypothetical protein QW682_01660 [Nitrososphaerota archaeon]
MLRNILDMLRIKSSPPFIILNKEEFRNFIIKVLNEITLKIVEKENMK